MLSFVHVIQCQAHMTALQAQGRVGRPGAGRGEVLAEPEDASDSAGMAGWEQLQAEENSGRRCP